MCATAWMRREDTMLRDGSRVPKGHTWYDSMDVERPEPANPWGEEADCWLPGAREREEQTGSDRNFEILKIF